MELVYAFQHMIFRFNWKLSSLYPFWSVLFFNSCVPFTFVFAISFERAILFRRNGIQCKIFSRTRIWFHLHIQGLLCVYGPHSSERVERLNAHSVQKFGPHYTTTYSVPKIFPNAWYLIFRVMTCSLRALSLSFISCENDRNNIRWCVAVGRMASCLLHRLLHTHTHTCPSILFNLLSKNFMSYAQMEQSVYITCSRM